jgi:hypothetical protein
MQVGYDHRQPGQVVGVAQHGVVRRVLLVGPEHRRLQRGVTSLDQMSWTVRVRRQPIGNRDHHRVPAGAEPQRQRGGVEQHRVAGFWPPHQGRVGQRAAGERLGRAGRVTSVTGAAGDHLGGPAGSVPLAARMRHDRHIEFDRPRPFTPNALDPAFTPSDHPGNGSVESASTGAAHRDRPGDERCWVNVAA